MTNEQLFEIPPTGEELEAVAARLFDMWAGLYRTNVTRGAVRPPRLDKKRERLIIKAINLYDTDTVEAAIRGVGCSDWHMGNNPQRKKYTDLELVLRDASHIERFAGYWDNRAVEDADTTTINRLRSEGGEW